MRAVRPLNLDQAWPPWITEKAAQSADPPKQPSLPGISLHLPVPDAPAGRILPLEHVGPKRNVGGMFDPDLSHEAEVGPGELSSPTGEGRPGKPPSPRGAGAAIHEQEPREERVPP